MGNNEHDNKSSLQWLHKAWWIQAAVGYQLHHTQLGLTAGCPRELTEGANGHLVTKGLAAAAAK